MKSTVSTTPIHDAIGIPTDILSTIEPEVRRIASIPYDSFVKDIDALTVALYASHPSACAELLKLPDGDLRRLAAENAKALHLKPCAIPPLATTGYFSKQLSKLLLIALKCSDYGAKLAQVFLSMLSHAGEHHLDDSLITHIKCFFAVHDCTNDFLLIEQTDEEYVILPGLRRR